MDPDPHLSFSPTFQPVFRIRIRGPDRRNRTVPLDYESGSGSCSFLSDFRCQQNKFFCIFPTVGEFSSVFKDNKSLRRHKTVEIKIFLNFFCLLTIGSESDEGYDPLPFVIQTYTTLLNLHNLNGLQVYFDNRRNSNYNKR
jgi:hypothetical protein